MKVFTTGQVAKICKVAPRTVSKWFDSGRLKGYRIPGSQDRRIPREYLIKFLKEHGMPLGDLEDEAMAKVLIVAQDQLMIENLKRELPLDHQKTSSSTSVGSVVLMGGQGKEIAMANRVASFLGVPFQEISPPNMGMGINIM